MNKPSGYITATEDRFQSTVLDLIDPSDWRRDLFPVGRLDKDTEGLLLLTNDGALAHMLTAPKYKVPKKYYFETIEEIDEKRLRTLLEGVDLGDLSPKQQVWKLGPKKEYWLSEGSSQVKRRCSTGIYDCVPKRTEFGPLFLDRSLPRGGYRYLTEEELASLKEAVR